MKYTATDKTAKEKTKSKNIKTRVIPGYHLSLGIVVTMLSVIVLIPLASVLVYSLKISLGDFVALIMKENVRNAFITSITASFIAAIVNVVFGLIVAWTLVKYDFPGKWLLDGLIELPFALPTAVAGITLSKLYSGTGFFGKGLGKLGIDVAYTQAGCFIRLGNLMNGEIVGTVTHVPWAFIFPHEDMQPRHPAQLYEAIAYLLIFIIGLRLYKKYKTTLYPGFYFGYCLTTIFTFRFLVEFIKASQEAFEDSMMLNMGQWLSIPFILLGAHFMYHSFKPVK